MSTQPIPILKSEGIAKAKRRAELRSDLLYVAGAVLVTIGMGLIRPKVGLIVGGVFCLMTPFLELASGFIRGLRVPQGRSQRSS